jgi:hypothetical protein
MTRKALESPVEVRQGLKADAVRNFVNPPIGVQEQIPRLLHSHPRHVFGEIDTGRLFEQFAKVKHAGMHVGGNPPER